MKRHLFIFSILLIFIIPIIALAQDYIYCDIGTPMANGGINHLHTKRYTYTNKQIYSWDDTYHYYTATEVESCINQKNGKTCPFHYENPKPVHDQEKHKKGELINSFSVVLDSMGSGTHMLGINLIYSCSCAGCSGTVNEQLFGKQPHSCKSHQYIGNNMYRHICQCGQTRVAPYGSHY